MSSWRASSRTASSTSRSGPGRSRVRGCALRLPRPLPTQARASQGDLHAPANSIAAALRFVPNAASFRFMCDVHTQYALVRSVFTHCALDWLSNQGKAASAIRFAHSYRLLFELCAHGNVHVMQKSVLKLSRHFSIRDTIRVSNSSLHRNKNIWAKAS